MSRGGMSNRNRHAQPPTFITPPGPASSALRLLAVETVERVKELLHVDPSDDKGDEYRRDDKASIEDKLEGAHGVAVELYVEEEREED